MTSALLNQVEEVRFSELISCGAGETVFTDPGCVPASSDNFLAYEEREDRTR